MTSAITRLKLLGDRADELTKFQADAELREIERKRAREEREARAQQQQAANISQSWLEAIDQRIWQHFVQNGERGPLAEAIGQALGHIRAETRKEFKTAIDTLRDELDAAKNQLQERLARLPLVKTWTPGAVAYCGDVIVFNGNTWQARKDTGQTPGDDDWILIARAGHDGCDGASFNPCGALNAHETYARFDLVECNGSSYVAIRDNPGVPGIDDGWQLIARGSRGPSGNVGPRGRKGERGARGENAPTIINWTLDHRRYTAIPTMSDGTAGAPLELRGLFEQFLIETQG